MKGPFARTGIAVAMLVAMGTYIYFVDSKRPASDEEVKEKVFEGFEAEDYAALTLTPGSGVRIRVERSEDGWRMTEPQQVEADTSAVDSLLQSLGGLEVDAEIADSEADLDQYGLESPRMTVEAEPTDAAPALAVLLGDKAPAGGGVYARVPSRAGVFTVPSHLETTFDKQPFDLRDRDLVKVERDEIVAVEVSGPSGRMALERAGDEAWRFTEPLETRAGRWTVDGLVGNVSNLKMESIANESTEDFAPYGLDPPAWSVVAKLKSGAELPIAIGTSPEDGRYHARVADASRVAVVSDALVKELEKGIDGLRSKRLIDASTYQVVALDAMLEGTAYAFEREDAEEGDDGFGEKSWKRTAPQAGDVATDAVQDVLYKVGGIDATQFVDAPEGLASYGLDVPTLRLAVRVEDGAEEWVELARQDEAVWARRSGDAAVMRVEAKALDELLEELGKITADQPPEG